MMIKNAWYMAAWAHELSATPLARRICNDPVVLFRTGEGEPVALIDACCHRGAPLSRGAVVKCGIRCNYHGMVFDKDGLCVEIPGQQSIPRKARVRSYPVVEKDSMIWIWMGNSELANPADILDYPYHGDRVNWPTRFAMSPARSNYLLLVDNLLDATHLAYVHPDSVGGAAPDVHFRAQMNVQRTRDGVRSERHMNGSPAPPAYTNCVAFSGPVDRWQEFDFIAPAVVLQYSGAVEAGKSREDRIGPRFDMRLFHALTPETQTTSFYFWSASNGHAKNDLAATDLIVTEITKAIVEDKAMVEAQQERISELGEDRLVDNRSDAVRILMRQAVDRFAKNSEGAGEPAGAQA
jgi:phenylpropionate dioxygenase-like ring-hydroxylating dioxygenase large terminal subunit